MKRNSRFKVERDMSGWVVYDTQKNNEIVWGTETPDDRRCFLSSIGRVVYPEQAARLVCRRMNRDYKKQVESEAEKKVFTSK